MSMTPYYVTAATSILSSVVGGGIGAWSAHNVLRRGQLEERRLRKQDLQQQVACDIINCLMLVKTSAYDQTGTRLFTEPAKSAIWDLQRVLASGMPALAGLDLESRLGRALNMILTRDDSVDLVDMPSVQKTFVVQRLHADRRAYLDWVVAALQDVAGGDDPPVDAPPPADLEDAEADAWTAPVAGERLSLARRIRRNISKSTDQ